MIFYKAIRYIILDQCMDIFFKNICKNFHKIKHTQETNGFVTVGRKFQKITEYPDYDTDIIKVDYHYVLITKMENDFDDRIMVTFYYHEVDIYYGDKTQSATFGQHTVFLDTCQFEE